MRNSIGGPMKILEMEKKNEKERQENVAKFNW